MTHDIPSLEVKLRNLGRSLDQLASEKHAEQLIPIIHRPGWTTVAEALFVHGMLDHLQAQVDDLSRAYDSLVNAAREVGPTHASG
jgi:hypothetical protein